MLKEIVVANKNYASLDVDAEETLDKTAMEVIRCDCPEFLFPIRLVNLDNEIQLRYEIAGGIRMSYMSMQMKKKELNQLLGQLLMPFMDCADWFLDYHNIYLDRDYIFVDQNDFKVKYIYFPYEKGTQTEEEILHFFGDIVMEVKLQDEPEYIATLLRCIMGKSASIMAFSTLVQENTEETRSTPIAQSVNAAPAKTVKNEASASAETKKIPAEENSTTPPAPASKKEFGKSDLASSLEMELFGDSNKKDKKEKKKEKEKKEKKDKGEKNKGLFGKLLGSDKKQKKENEKEILDEPPTPETSEMGKNVAKMSSDSDKTEYVMPDSGNTEFVITEGISTENTIYLSLENTSVDNVPSRIELDMSKGYAVVGRYDKSGKLSADFNFDMSLTFIGRRHARFEKAGNTFYIIDMESKNHTYLNGEELLPNRRYPLNRGDRITFTKMYNIIYSVC